MTEFRVSRHAEWEMARRGIPLAMARSVVDAPEQRLRDESGSAWIYQSRVRFADGRIYLLRVVVAEEHTPPVVITAYRTSKIEKYWSGE
jgi:hypothetical protein